MTNDGRVLSAINRAMWARNLAAAFVLDAIIVYVAMYLFSSEYDRPGVGSVLIGIIVLWGLQLALSAKNWIIAMVTFKAFQQPLLVDSFLQILRSYKLDPPSLTEPKRFDYLAMLADDDTAGSEDRVKAATLYGQWIGVMQARGFYVTLEMTRSWDEAVRRYAAEAPPSRRGY